MANKKVLYIRKDNKYAGSQSLEGKDAPKNIGENPNKVLQNILVKSGGEYRLAVQEFDARYEMDLHKAKIVFVESLSPEAKVAYFKYDGWNAFDLDELIEAKDQEKYTEACKVLREKLDNATRERSLATDPFWKKMQTEFAEAKKNHPKKWWQSYSSWMGDICEDCGAKIVDYCQKCNPNA